LHIFRVQVRYQNYYYSRNTHLQHHANEEREASHFERFRVVCRIPSLQDEWNPSSTFADAINKNYQLSGDEVITVKDLNDTITRDSILQSDFFASKKQGNKSGIYQAKKTTGMGRREYAYYSASGKVEDTEDNFTTPKRMRKSTRNNITSPKRMSRKTRNNVPALSSPPPKEDFPQASCWSTLANSGKDTVGAIRPLRNTHSRNAQTMDSPERTRCCKSNDSKCPTSP